MAERLKPLNLETPPVNAPINIKAGETRVRFENRIDRLRSFLGNKIDVIVGTRVGEYKNNKCLVEPDRAIFYGSGVVDLLIVDNNVVELYYDRPSLEEIEPIAY